MAQPKIPGTDIGKVGIPFGSDGSDWIALLVSGLGALQVELASLPTGAVTIADGADVVLGALADAVVAAGAVGSVSGKLRRLTTDLNALLTELKLKADLLDTQPVSVASLPLPSLASTSTLQGTMITALQSIQNLVGALNDVGINELRVRSSHGDKIFGFESIVEQDLLNDDLATGDQYMNGTAVGDGKVWMINNISFMYAGTVPTSVSVYAWGLASIMVLKVQAAPVSGQWYTWTGTLYLRKDDYIALDIIGATLHDDCTLRYAGVRMNAP